MNGKGSALSGARQGLSDRPWTLRRPRALSIVIGKARVENLSTAAAVPLPFQGRFGELNALSSLKGEMLP